MRDEQVNDLPGVRHVPMNYQEEMEMRREQERQDQEFAHRLEMMNLGGDPFIPHAQGVHGRHQHDQNFPPDFMQPVHDPPAVPFDEAAFRAEGERIAAQIRRFQQTNNVEFVPPRRPMYFEPMAPPQAPHAPFRRAHGALVPDGMMDGPALRERMNQHLAGEDGRRGRDGGRPRARVEPWW